MEHGTKMVLVMVSVSVHVIVFVEVGGVGLLDVVHGCTGVVVVEDFFDEAEVVCALELEVVHLLVEAVDVVLKTPQPDSPG